MSNNSIYNEMIKKYYKTIFAYCFVRLKNKASAEDCTQEVFLLLYKKWGSVKNFDNINAWLHRTADNVMKKYISRNVKESPMPDDILDIPIQENFFDGNNVFDLIGKDDYDLLLNYYIAGKNLKEIADELGVSEIVLRKRIQRIRDKIKKHLYKGDK